jgi:hypothetical protein
MPTRNDPLKQFREGVRAPVRGEEQPVPLISTAFSVEMRGDIGAVTSARTFRNQESQDIEPTMTFLANAASTSQGSTGGEKMRAIGARNCSGPPHLAVFRST